MAKIPKSSNFRTVYAAGVYVAASQTELRLLLVNNEAVEIETESGESKQETKIQEVPHIQAEIIMGKDLARWIRDYLNAYLAQSEVPPK